jgi:hypothetical protein
MWLKVIVRRGEEEISWGRRWMVRSLMFEAAESPGCGKSDDLALGFHSGQSRDRWFGRMYSARDIENYISAIYPSLLRITCVHIWRPFA